MPQDAEGHGGDNDPIDVMEVGDGPLPMGTIVAIKVLGYVPRSSVRSFASLLVVMAVAKICRPYLPCAFEHVSKFCVSVYDFQQLLFEIVAEELLHDPALYGRGDVFLLC